VKEFFPKKKVYYGMEIIPKYQNGKNTKINKFEALGIKE